MKLGILLNDTHTTFTNVTELKNMVVPYIRKAIEQAEGITIPKGELVAAVQKYVNEYGECIIDNQLSDYGTVQFTIIGVGEVVDHICNMGWITKDRTSINNSLQNELILNWFNSKNIQDYEYKD